MKLHSGCFSQQSLGELIEPSQTLPVVSGRKSPDYVLGFKYQRDTATNYFPLIPRIQ